MGKVSNIGPTFVLSLICMQQLDLGRQSDLVWTFFGWEVAVIFQGIVKEGETRI